MPFYNTEKPKIGDWELEHVTSKEWEQDTSGLYTVIHRVVTPGVHKGIAGERVEIRVDIMSADDEPVRSFQSVSPHDLRIAVARFLSAYRPEMGISHCSYEHLAYIGAEIQRAYTDENYKQD
jgi:hypothetical protein